MKRRPPQCGCAGGKLENSALSHCGDAQEGNSEQAFHKLLTIGFGEMIGVVIGFDCLYSARP